MIKDATIFWIIAGTAFFGMILFAIGTNLFAKKIEARGPAYEAKISRLIKIVMFIFFVILGFSIVPIFVKYFTDALPSVITQSTLPVLLRDNAMMLVYVFWGIYVIGLAIAVPASIKDGFFEDRDDSPGQH